MNGTQRIPLLIYIPLTALVVGLWASGCSKPTPTVAGSRDKGTSEKTTNEISNGEAAGGGVADPGVAPHIDLPAGLSLADYRAAEQQFKARVADRDTRHEDVLLMAADLAASEHKLDVALACYRLIATDFPDLGLVARLQEGLLLVENNRAAEAEGAFQAFLAAARVATRVKPQDVVTAFKWLTYILSVEIRLEERKPLLMELHAIQLADPLDSKQLYFPQLLILNSPAGRTRIESFLKNDPSNVRLRLAQARYKTLEGQFDVAIELLEKLHQEYAADKGIAAALMEAYFQSGETDKITGVLSSLPEFQEDEPWLLIRMRGEAAFLANDYPAAEKYFTAALKQDATYAPCQIGLSRVYAAQGNQEAQKHALERSTLMADIRVNLTKVQPDAAAAAAELAEKCRQLGLEDAAKTFDAHAQNIARAQAATPKPAGAP